MTPEVIWKPGSEAYVKIEESIIDWELNITEKQGSIQVMLEDVYLDQSVFSNAIISSI